MKGNGENYTTRRRNAQPPAAKKANAPRRRIRRNIKRGKPSAVATYPARIPASRNRSTVRQSIRHHRTRRADSPRPCAGFRPPSVQSLPVRPAIAATVRASPATFGRIRRQSIENGLASRPPRRPCPRPSETRRAFCKPSAPRLQRNQRKPSGNPATVRPWRNLSGDRVPVATIERRNLSGNIERGERAPPVSVSTWRPWRTSTAAPDSSPPCASLSGKPWRTSNAATVRNRAPVYPATPRNRSTVRQSPPSNAATVRPWRTSKRRKRPRHHRNAGNRAPDSSATYPPPSNAATVRADSVRRNIERGDRSTVRQSFRQAVAVRPLAAPDSGNIERGKPWRPLAGFVGNAAQPFALPACQRFDRAATYPASRRDRRQGFRPMSPDSARRPFNRWPLALLSRQSFDPRPPKSRRKRP